MTVAAPDPSLHGHLVDLERALHDPDVRADAARLAALLDDGFSEIGSSGNAFDRSAALAEIPRQRAQVVIESDDFHVRLLAPSLAQVRYRSCYVVEGVHQRMSLRSSLWRLHDGRWRMLFHQGTPAAE